MYKILLVDDEPRIRHGLKHCIPWKQLGFSVEGEAEDGKQALELALEHCPDLILTDIRMPDMDGLDFIESIRNVGLHSLIIIISGYSDFDYAQRAIHYGVTDYLLKPIEEERLYDCILNCVKKLELADEIRARQGIPDLDQLSAAKHNAIIENVLGYLAKNYQRELSLSDVAEWAAVHPNYLSTLFTKTMNENFTRYLARLRVAKAKELLLHSQLKIYEVAELVGYSDYRWFSKLFKLFEGVTPAEYRNRTGGQE